MIFLMLKIFSTSGVHLEWGWNVALFPPKTDRRSILRARWPIHRHPTDWRRHHLVCHQGRARAWAPSVWWHGERRGWALLRQHPVPLSFPGPPQCRVTVLFPTTWLCTTEWHRHWLTSMDCFGSITVLFMAGRNIFLSHIAVISLFLCMWFCFLFCSTALGIKPRNSHLLGKHSPLSWKHPGPRPPSQGCRTESQCWVQTTLFHPQL